MSEKMPCELIQDLLPSYHDKLTSDTTNQIVETHLGECSVCSEMLRDMDTPTVAEQELSAASPPIIDFLRKVRRMDRWKVVVCCVVAVLLTCIAAKLLQQNVGHNVSDYTGKLNITVDGDTIYVDGAMAIPNYSVTKVEIRPQAQKSKTGEYLSGYYTVIVYGNESRKSTDGSVAEFHAEKTIKTDVRGIYLGGQTGSSLVWSEREMISYRVRWFYESVKEFMNDPTIFGTDCFDVQEVTGSFTQTLDDAAQPTALLISLDDVQHQADMPTVLEKSKLYAYAFLSAANELDRVEVTYVTAEEGESTATFTREEADAYVGGNISAQAKTIAGKAKLLRTLGLVDNTVMRES